MKIHIHVILSDFQNKLNIGFKNKGEKTYYTPKKATKERETKMEEIVQNKMVEINTKISIVITVHRLRSPINIFPTLD